MKIRKFVQLPIEFEGVVYDGTEECREFIIDFTRNSENSAYTSIEYDPSAIIMEYDRSARVFSHKGSDVFISLYLNGIGKIHEGDFIIKNTTMLKGLEHRKGEIYTKGRKNVFKVFNKKRMEAELTEISEKESFDCKCKCKK